MLKSSNEAGAYLFVELLEIIDTGAVSVALSVCPLAILAGTFDLYQFLFQNWSRSISAIEHRNSDALAKGDLVVPP